MALESLTGVSVFIDDLVSTNPVGSTDPISDVDGHIQGIKNVLLNSFPGVTGAVTPTHTELNVIDAGATVTTPVVASGDAFVMDDLDVGMVQVDIDNVDTYLAQTTKTLTNKTLTAPIISTISNTGTVTLPTATDTLVGKATTDTLTNKTINAANNTITNVPTTGLKTTTASLAGVLNNNESTVISLNAYSFFPMIHQSNSAATVTLQGGLTDQVSADSPQFSIRNDSGGAESYDVDYRYIQA